MVQGINEDWFRCFFKNGAFLRKESGQVVVWQGPWRDSSQEQSESSISVQDYFSSNATQYSTVNGFLQLSAVDLIRCLTRAFPEPNNDGRIKIADFSKLNQELFAESFRIIQGKIQREEVEKAVPCQFAYTERRPEIEDQIQWLKSLLSAPENLFPFGIWSEHFGLMGASPEILFSREGHLIHSMALAGTMLRSADCNPQSLLKSSKDRHEHQLVVADLEQQLGQLGWVKKSETHVLELPTLFHLRTSFEAEIGNRSDEDLIRQLHPTSALGVYPRAFGHHWLEQLPEQQQRGAFGAPVLFRYGKMHSTCVVAIRSLFWGAQGSKVGVGCGIVRESQFDTEWEELKNKLDSIWKLLGMQ